ncbi:hypothetical protein CU044_4903 [Streptomyces sp. L-9-10]|uniref:hypothetical protein n=1 Tax=Streptomyces sp. L-9-10 TaxID=1478131 RepID=UPI00101D0C7E|nr:hypothetical protein [Streptomyces sp. L-9-10]RYJ24992.1 hypothetical protein CU044_4903 [Streptomyces sp. L-9-10]
MISRAPLPPPPPEEPGPWPDHAARLAERAEAMVELSRRGLSLGRLVALWLAGALAVVGWAAVGAAIQSFEGGGLGLMTGVVLLGLAAVLLVPAAVAVGFWLSRGRLIRERLAAWAESAPERVTDLRVGAHRRSVMWLLPSVLLCLVGVWATGRALAEAVSGGATGRESVTLGETAYALGLGGTLLVTGLLGLVPSVRHQCWSGRLMRPALIRGGGGAHR